ncbi:M23 family metallopeptidase [Streptomyces sp. TRM 70351]|uniref:M23 family metallopeptidase n=1 Tax=Streptomyces sp. TRM 70351 TaxID=3116552 RepID=UPI002E7B96D1|nr:M23 family metallopeptidase [Streptomyces sp. TRM 70351]MEE1929904.1 M23 family metallopeptidase [Streptomyces sp. TRM 70351]
MPTSRGATPRPRLTRSALSVWTAALALTLVPAAVPVIAPAQSAAAAQPRPAGPDHLGRAAPRPPGGPARAGGSPQTAVAEAARIYREATRAGQRYERARAATARQRERVDRLSGELAGQRAEYAELRRAIGSAAAGQYRGSGLLAGARVVLADSPEAFLHSTASMLRGNRAAARLAESARQARVRLERQRAEAARALARLRTEEARRLRLKRQVGAELDRARARAARMGTRTAMGHGGAGSWAAPVAAYRLSAGYAASGSRWAGRHTGQDFAVRTGTPVRAVGAGTVVRAGYAGAFGNRVVVRHGDGFETYYAHLSVLQTGAGQRVRAGQQIGLSGSTGNSSGPHLHFEVRPSGAARGVDPVPWLRARGVRL